MTPKPSVKKDAERKLIRADATKYGLGIREYLRYLALVNHKKPRKVLDITGLD